MVDTQIIPPLDGLLKWRGPKRVSTADGLRDLLVAKHTPDFSRLWHANKEALRALGISWDKDPEGNWIVCWFRRIPEAEERRLKESRALETTEEFPVPVGLAYDPYQKSGIKFCLDLFKGGQEGVIIGDEMGLGKTVQAIGVINSDRRIHRVLVICPKRVVLNWVSELRKWLVRDQNVGIADTKCWPTTDVIVTNYHAILKWPTKASLYWDLIVIDEFHELRNRQTRIAKGIFGYKPNRKESKEGMAPTSGIPAKRKIGLSGTPICNKTPEMWPMLNYLDPKRWTSYSAFCSRYSRGGFNGWGGWEYRGSQNEAELQGILRSTVMIRRLKKDVLKDLPPKRRQIIEIPAEGELRELLRSQNAIEKDFEDRLAQMKARIEIARASEDQAGYEAAVEGLSRERSTADKAGFAVAHAIARKKVPFVAEHVGDSIGEQGYKTILFAHHHDVLRDYMEELKAFRPVTVHGEQTTEQSHRAVQQFQSDPEIGAIICGIRAAGVGLTMTAASLVVFGEIDWVPAVMLQAEDRAHRRGQMNPVLVQQMVLQNSMDARKAEVLVEKMVIIEKALDLETTAQTMKEPVVMSRGVTVSTADLKKARSGLTARHIAAVQAGLKTLSFQLELAGMSRVDGLIGADLVRRAVLTPGQAMLGYKLVSRYRKVISPDVCGALGL